MLVVIRLVSLAIFVMGCAYAFRPDLLLRAVRFWTRANHMYLGALLRFSIGLIFILGAPRTRLSAAFYLIGSITLLTALAVLWIGPEKAGAQLRAFAENNQNFRKFAATLAIATGGVLFLLA